MKNAQEPAFPLQPTFNSEGQVCEQRFEYEGITKLEYFIAHAPAVPEWFKPEMLPDCPEMLPRLYAKFDGEDEQALMKKYYDNEDGTWHDENNEVPVSLKDEVAIYIAAIEANKKEIEKWESDEQMQTIIQWRYYYAQEQLKLIEKLSDLNSDEWIKK